MPGSDPEGLGDPVHPQNLSWSRKFANFTQPSVTATEVTHQNYLADAASTLNHPVVASITAHSLGGMLAGATSLAEMLN